MMDLIDREQALKAIKNELAYQEKHATPGEDIDTGIICGLGQAVEIVKGIEPSAEKTGRWIEQSDEYNDTIYQCSVCGEEFVTIEGTPADNLWNYCPNCGARMVE